MALVAILSFSACFAALGPDSSNAATVIDGGTFGDTNNLTWEFTDNGTLTISGAGAMPD